MVHIAIVEDESEAAVHLQSCLCRFSEEHQTPIEITIFPDAVSFLDPYRSTFDSVFMDIELPGMNGMEAARRLRETDRVITLVFVTNMAQYAVKGYEVDALDFIVKPVRYPDIVFKMKRILENLRINKTREVTIPLPKGGFQRVSSTELFYVEVSNHNLRYHLASGILETGGTLSKAEEELKSWGFLRCNSCFLVNPRYVEWIRGHTVKVAQDELQISHPKRKDFLKNMTDWLAKGGR